MKKKIVIYPFIFAVYPIIFLYSHNISITPLKEIFIPVAIVLISTFCLFLLLGIFLKNKHKSGILIFILILMLLYLRDFYGLVVDAQLAGITVGRLRYLLPICVLISALGSYFTLKTRKSLTNLTKLLNIVAGCLLAISVINILIFKNQANSVINILTFKNQSNIKDMEDKFKFKFEAGSTDARKISMLPDIYYIILDAYARQDVLREIYHYDNSEFLDFLTRSGFYVADKSHSNYCMTDLSLSSSLNFEYIDVLTGHKPISHTGLLKIMIEKNRVFDILRQYGYEIIVLPYPEIMSSDIKDVMYLICHSKKKRKWSEFHRMLLNKISFTFAGRFLVPFDYAYKRETILYKLDKLGDIANIRAKDGPVFVYAHILCPHQPFVFGAKGEPLNPMNMNRMGMAGKEHWRDKKEYINGYTNQMSFINMKIQETVEKILSNSLTPPIIIIQGDHGPEAEADFRNVEATNHWERMSILNAYYFPDGCNDFLYKSITPVNTFRVIFNRYFGMNFDFLEGNSYFSETRSYEFINVTDKVSKK